MIEKCLDKKREKSILDQFTFGNLKPAQQIVLSFAGVILTEGSCYGYPLVTKPQRRRRLSWIICSPQP